jgi:hypothetical protein
MVVVVILWRYYHEATLVLCQGCVDGFCLLYLWQGQVLDEILEGTREPVNLQRISTFVDGIKVSSPALNDVLVAHPNPAAVSRCTFRYCEICYCVISQWVFNILCFVHVLIFYSPRSLAYFLLPAEKRMEMPLFCTVLNLWKAPVIWALWVVQHFEGGNRQTKNTCYSLSIKWAKDLHSNRINSSNEICRGWCNALVINWLTVHG